MDNKFSCEVIRDLIPLVKDGIASEDSERLVTEHIKTCEECRKLLGEFNIPEIEGEKAVFMQLKKRFTLFSAFIMFAAMFLGLSLTFEADMFYNSFIMPIVGALGYTVFKLKAVLSVPAIIFGLNISMSLINIIRGLEDGSFFVTISSSLMWAFIYSLFAILGVIIAYLFHYAFKKEK